MESIGAPRSLNLDASNLEEEWKSFEQRFDLFRVASGADSKPEATQVALFLHCAGESAQRLFNSFTFESDADKKKLKPIYDKFEDYCTPRKNEIVERCQFHDMKQAHGQTIDNFVAALRLKAQSCNFGDQTEQLIRDRIVCGCFDARVKERMLRESKLTLQSALALCRAAEASHEQMKVFKTESSVAAVTTNHNRQDVRSTGNGRAANCGRCGRRRHGADQMCPAADKECRSCGRKGHYELMCRTKMKSQPSHQQFSRSPSRGASRNRGRSPSTRRNDSVNSVSVTEEPGLYVQNCFIGSWSGVIDDDETSWWQFLTVNGEPLRCKLDPGAQGNVMSMAVYDEMKDKPVLRKTDIQLYDFASRQISPHGIASFAVEHKGVTYKQDFYIVPGKSPTLIGLPACKLMDLVRRVDQVEKVTPVQTTSSLLQEYNDVFEGLGRLPGTYHITVDNNVQPVVHALRKVPLALQPKLKKLLDHEVERGVMVKRDEPTDWVSSLLCVEKKDGSLRVCLDPRDLNKAIKREHYAIPTFDDVVAHFQGKKVFTVIDLKEGFWQIGLDEDSSRLLTFNTPFGRYSFTRLAFGISSAPEIFQKRMNCVFGDIDGVHVVFDDLIIAAENDDEHDKILRKLLERARQNGVRFNKNKLQLKVQTVKYLGNILTPDGVKPDQEKVSTIVNMPAPTDAKGVQRFIGLVNYLSKFVPHFSNLTEPLRNIQKSDSDFVWSPSCQDAFDRIKQKIISAPVLQYFDPTKHTVIQTDASSKGLGSCLMQNGLPIAFASRALTDAETRYAQIEKELLAIVFACEKFAYYVYGRQVEVQSDHKPLESLFKKSLCTTTPRLQRMLMRLLKYNLEVRYTPGKQMYVADTLSRAYVHGEPTEVEKDIASDICVMVNTVLFEFPASNKRLDELRAETERDTELCQLKECVSNGFSGDLPPGVRHYGKFAQDIYELDGLLFVHGKLIVPSSMRSYMLKLIHEGHLGMDKCKSMAREILYWPGMNADIENVVAKCSVCNSYRRKQQPEPLLPHTPPGRPWAKLGADIFTYKNTDYLLIVDYYSKYPEIAVMPDKTAASVISQMKQVFARHGIPDEVICDNMPFASYQMQTFAREWCFTVTTSSPRYAQSNGQSERAIQTVKNLLKKASASNTDVNLALLQYRNTAVTGLDYSPAQLLFSRSLNTLLPVCVENLYPQVREDARDQLVNRQGKQKHYYDRGTRALPPLESGDVVRVDHNGQWQRGQVVRSSDTPRSYDVLMENGNTLRRNRRDVIHTAEDPPVCAPLVDEIDTPSFSDNDNEQQHQQSLTPPTASCLKTTKSGRVVKPPVRFRDYKL